MTTTAPEGVSLCSFKVVIDNREKAPFHFTGLATNKINGQNTPIIVETITDRSLKTGDYSIDGLENEVCIERKSKVDLYGSIGRNRERLEREFERMQFMQFSALVVEADWEEVLLSPPVQSSLEPLSVSRTALSWSVKYPKTHWFMCFDRRHAEIVTFRLLEFFWKYREEEKKQQRDFEEDENGNWIPKYVKV